MPIISLTGSAEGRIAEIQDHWVVAEPQSDGRLYEYPLYTVPLGQTFAAEMIINTGSIYFENNVLNIKKDIHVFQDQTEATKFISEVGSDYISSIIEREEVLPDSTTRLITEVHLINFPQAKVSFELKNITSERGYKVEIFASGAFGLYEVEKKAIFNARDELVSDTYLKYFEIEADVE